MSSTFYPRACTYGRFGNIWVDVASVVEGFHDALETLFDALDPFLSLFDVL